MRNNGLSFKDLNGGLPYILPTEPFLLHSLGSHICSQISSLVDNSLHQTRCLHVPRSVALQETFYGISRVTNAIVYWFASGSASNLGQRIVGNLPASESGSCRFARLVRQISSTASNNEFVSPELFNRIASFILRHLSKETDKLRSFPMLSIAAVLVPPFGNLSSKVLDVLPGSADVRSHICPDQRPCEVENRGCSGLSVPDLYWKEHAVEPRTGIEFPMILDSILAVERNCNLTSKILVGTGSRSMKIIKIKSLKVYAFGFYIHPYSVCKKLGAKYASMPISEVNKCQTFYEDLLREDINMTVRLVVNCNGMKINTVRDAFEKSLRARLLKTNPNTDYHCLSKFGSIFPRDIPLPMGTTIDFHRTADGNLVTEIGGNKIGTVQSRELCRAFFDMYIGDLPVSEFAKEEIGKNVAGIIMRC
ncbi:fatty-acid-binding protein 2 [Rhodamnia argentea]|uniref:Fatty-acid-binding protein 2 n=1 Tax=Rhodamnia argentea TaxID=178133 RepID=A0A8B8P6S1_9MYRT|nr:fatty-acid-binding protein 2 [Rhodamnia argentea]XP_030530551.1 fatty-acid-binding protein 2 [Rhodamnia argentea]XP_030530552.1 fatty-acid-binding protein 2 [Rhodamnia argentea]XP_048133086.1 fatty-acid-binding protein 2 [Rhodamnia argentea]